MSFSSSETWFPSRREINTAISSFSFKQKIALTALFIIFIGSLFLMAEKIDRSFLVETAIKGGALNEGIIGTPSFINPLLATTDADRDLTTLLFSGLMRIDNSGQLIPDLAESYDISSDGLTYTFKLKKDLYWHDGEKITPADIAFTIAKAQESTLKSAKRANWEGVTVVKGDNEVKFILKKPYAAFLENTTLGILPEHLWKSVANDSFYLSKYNIEAIGSGAYQIEKIDRDSSGVPTAYNLTPFNKFALGEPKIANVKIVFYPNEEKLKEGFQKGEVESLSAISPDTSKELLENGTKITQIPLPRIFALFFNQNQAEIFTNKEVRQALNLATDRQKIINEVLKGYGVPINGAFPPGTLGYIEDPAAKKTDLAEAKKILEKAGWKLNSSGVMERTVKKKTQTLAFEISSTNIPELKATALILAADWAKIGVKATVRVYELGDLNQNAIKTRKFDTLLFGEVIGRNPDPFSFWHSSQRLYPGLNVAQYANVKVDKLLEQSRITTAEDSKLSQYESIESEIAKDQPAIFIYSPYFLYAVPEKIKGEKFTSLNTPAERFLGIYKWYTNSERVWKIFAQNNTIEKNTVK